MLPFVEALAHEGRRIAVVFSLSAPGDGGRAGADRTRSFTTPIPGSTTRSSVPVRRWRSGSSMALVPDTADDLRAAPPAGVVRSAVARLRESIATRARALPLARHAWARYRRRRYEQRISRFLEEKTGRADRLPIGAVYEATMRCNLHCEFCYVGDLLNIEGEWREEMTLDALRKAFPDNPGFQVSLTGGEIFMRKDIMSVLDLFRDKGYACGYLTTNGTIITRGARRGAGRPRGGRLPEAHQRLDRRSRRDARRRPRPEGHVRADLRRPAPAAGRGADASTPRCASASTRPWRTKASTRSTRWSMSPRSSASTRSGSIT